MASTEELNVDEITSRAERFCSDLKSAKISGHSGKFSLHLALIADPDLNIGDQVSFLMNARDDMLALCAYIKILKEQIEFARTQTQDMPKMSSCQSTINQSSE